MAISAKITGATPKIFGYELLTVLSGSMEPSIKTGGIIAVKPLKNIDKLKINEVITFKAIDDPNTLITHRIIDIQTNNGKKQFITKGDNNDTQDLAPIPAENIVAKYTGFTIPLVGSMIAFAKTKVGIISLLIVPGALLFLWQLGSLWRYIARMDDQKDEQIS